MSVVLPEFIANGVKFPDPTEFKWILPTVRGEDGFGYVRHNPYYSFEMSWDVLSPLEYFSGILRVYQGSFLSGGVTIRLPRLDSLNYEFVNYSGAIMERPEVGIYRENYITNVKVVIKKIRVNHV